MTGQLLVLSLVNTITAKLPLGAEQMDPHASCVVRSWRSARNPPTRRMNCCLSSLGVCSSVATYLECSVPACAVCKEVKFNAEKANNKPRVRLFLGMEGFISRQ